MRYGVVRPTSARAWSCLRSQTHARRLHGLCAARWRIPITRHSTSAGGRTAWQPLRARMKQWPHVRGLRRHSVCLTIGDLKRQQRKVRIYESGPRELGPGDRDGLDDRDEAVERRQRPTASVDSDDEGARTAGVNAPATPARTKSRSQCRASSEAIRIPTATSRLSRSNPRPPQPRNGPATSQPVPSVRDPVFRLRPLDRQPTATSCFANLRKPISLTSLPSAGGKLCGALLHPA